MRFAACGGNIPNKTTEEAQNIIEDLSVSSRHFRTKVKGVSNMKNSTAQVNEAIVSEVRDLQAMMKEIMREKNKDRVCGVCDSVIQDTSDCHIQPQAPQDPNEAQVVGIGKTNNKKPK